MFSKNLKQILVNSNEKTAQDRVLFLHLNQFYWNNRALVALSDY